MTQPLGLARAPVRWRYGVPWGAAIGWLLLAGVVYMFTISTAGVGYGAAIGTVIVIGLVVTDGLERPGVRVTEREQPDLFAVVHDVAARGGLRRPDAIWLTHAAEIEAQVRLGRREILIGQALVPCLTEPELRALIAHELAILRHRSAGMIIRLMRAWTGATARADVEPPKPRLSRRAAHLRPFAEAVHAVADAAAVSAGGHHAVVGRALVMTGYVDSEYEDFALDTTGPPHRWWQRPRVIEDLDDAWRRWITHSTAMSLTGADEMLDAFVDRQHPPLSGTAHRLGAGQLSLAPATPAVVLRPLSPRHRRRLVRRVRRLTNRDAARWYTFATAPDEWWADRARVAAESLREDVAAVLGREPVDDLECAEVLVTRNADVFALRRARWEIDPATPEPEPPSTDYTPPPELCALVETVLLGRGWRLEHPAIRGVLIGTGGERVDAARSVTWTETAGFNLEPLRAILHDPRDHEVSVAKSRRS